MRRIGGRKRNKRHHWNYRSCSQRPSHWQVSQARTQASSPHGGNVRLSDSDSNDVDSNITVMLAVLRVDSHKGKGARTRTIWDVRTRRPDKRKNVQLHGDKPKEPAITAFVAGQERYQPKKPSIKKTTMGFWGTSRAMEATNQSFETSRLEIAKPPSPR